VTYKKRKIIKMTDPNLLLDCSETVLLNQEHIFTNIEQGTQILQKLELMEKMTPQEMARYLMLNDGLQLESSTVGGKVVIKATDLLYVINGEVAASNIICVVDAKMAITKLNIPLMDGSYGLEKYSQIINNNPTFHKSICLPYEFKGLSPKVIEMVSPTSKVILEEVAQVVLNGKTSFVQTYLDVKSPRHLSSRIGLAIMIIGAMGKIV
tara:strand:- start:642 stop:1268 length:627 start_codon:yes stop_codon:yes gene_type:complete